MKKTLAILLALSVSVAAYAQMPDDNQFFNHLSVGVGLLGTDGEGIQVAAPINPYIQIRGGFTTHALFFGVGNAVAKSIGASQNIPEIANGINPFTYTIKDINFEQGAIKIDDLNLEAKLKSSNLELLFDFFPGKNTGFHFTVGTYISLCGKGLVQAVAKPTRKDGQQAIPASMRGTAEIYGLTTDLDGNFSLDLQFKNKVLRPYVGIGFGRPVSLKHRVGVNFDMGVAYMGGVKLVSYNYYNYQETGKAEIVTLDQAWVDKYLANDDDTKEMAGEIKKYLDMTETMPYALATKFYPIMKLTLFIRLF